MNPTCVRATPRCKGELVDQRDVKSRRVKAAARDGDEVRDAILGDVRVGQCPLRRDECQGTGLDFVHLHPIARGRACVTVERLTPGQVAIRRLQNHTVPRCDAGSLVNGLHHALVSGSFARIRPSDKGCVTLPDAVRWNGCADPADQDRHVGLAFVRDDGAFKCRTTNPANAGSRLRTSNPVAANHGRRNPIATARQTR